MTETQTATEVLQSAEALFAQDPDWVTFFQRMLGLGGLIRQTYTTPESLAEFEQSEAYARIQQMLAKLRERQSDAPSPRKDTKVITVRLPKSLHDALREESYEYRTSINKLCISKLLQFVARELVPPERYKRIAAEEAAGSGEATDEEETRRG